MTTIETGSDDLRAEITDRVAVLTMNRPQHRNAFSEEMTAALDRVCPTWRSMRPSVASC
jgi:enoyl-CoA hydratase/carnithine racemase